MSCYKLLLLLLYHYCRMLLTWHYDQRPFHETVRDALITNGDVKNRQKRCKTFAMGDASNMVQILVACAMQGIRFSSINLLRWGGTKETSSQMKVCAIYIIRFTRMNCLWLGNTKERSARSRCVRYTACGSLGWTIWFEPREQKRFNIISCVWYATNRSVIGNVCEDR